ncbi:MAG: ABC transporter substrate-binding protein [Acetobacteraceae bacterium]
MKLRGWLPALAMVPALLVGGIAHAATAPSEIKIGTLYAGSGPYASISMPVHDGLELWVKHVNSQGGVLVKAFNKKIPIKLISYDDQSSTATAATLYNQLITQDHVDLMLSDSGSVLTSVAVPIAKEHKTFLFDVSGTGGAFFTKDNPYIALLSLPVATMLPKDVADFLDDVGVKHGIKTVAVLYSTNDFTGSVAAAFKDFIQKSGKIKIVYDQGVPTSTSNYTVLINNIAAHKPDAVVELGYVGNDIAFLRNLEDSGLQFPFVFTIYSGIETDEVLKNVGVPAMTHVFSWVSPSRYEYKVNFGPTLPQFHAIWDKAYPKGSGVAWGANSVYGYMSGLVVERTLETAKGLSPMDLHDAVFALSGQLKTLGGAFALSDEGAQIGELAPVGQLQPDGKGGLDMVTVYPPNYAKGAAVIGK